MKVPVGFPMWFPLNAKSDSKLKSMGIHIGSKLKSIEIGSYAISCKLKSIESKLKSIESKLLWDSK